MTGLACRGRMAAFAQVATGVDLRLRYTLCAGCSFAKRNQGADDTIDSDAKVNEGATGSTASFRLSQGSQSLTSVDAGMRLPSSNCRRPGRRGSWASLPRGVGVPGGSGRS